MFRPALLILLAGVLVAPAHAGSTQWHVVEGGSVRLAMSGAPEEAGMLRAAIEIRLEPGWKTYWLDPGSAGVPPSLELDTSAGPAEVAIGFPPPLHFDDENGDWAGYDRSVALAVTARLPEGAAGTATARLFLGICETICIPVQATWTLDLKPAQTSGADAAVVSAAFEALPGKARPGFGATLTAVSETEIAVAVEAPAKAEVIDLFVAGTETIALGRPERLPSGGSSGFAVPILGLYGKDPWQKPLRYTLVTSKGAVSGLLERQ